MGARTGTWRGRRLISPSSRFEKQIKDIQDKSEKVKGDVSYTYESLWQWACV